MLDERMFFGVPVFELNGMLCEVLEEVWPSTQEEFAFSLGDYYVCTAYTDCDYMVLISDKEYRLLHYVVSERSDVSYPPAFLEYSEEEYIPLGDISYELTSNGFFSLLLATAMREGKDLRELIVELDAKAHYDKLAEVNPEWFCEYSCVGWEGKVRELYAEHYDSGCFIKAYKHGDLYLVHGEIDIACYDAEFKRLWNFCGRDIFVTTDDSEAFVLTDSGILLKDFLGNSYLLGYDGKELGYRASDSQ